MITFSHTTALQYWRSYDGKALGMPPYAPINQWGSPLSASLLSMDSPLIPSGATAPFHVIVDDAGNRRRSSNVISHQWSHPVSREDLFKLNETVSVCSPELCYLQLAHWLPLEKTILLGMELCGLYRLITNSSNGFIPQPPLSSPKRLLGCVKRIPGTYGHTKALRACKYILPNSASPMESAFALLLSLPYLLGGYAIARPTLNERIVLGARMQKITRTTELSCDLYWPKYRFAMEYDSKQWHSGEEQLFHDAQRRGILSHRGLEVLAVSSRQVFNLHETEKLALMAAKKTGKVIPGSKRGDSEARIRLRGNVLDFREDRLV